MKAVKKLLALVLASALALTLLTGCGGGGGGGGAEKVTINGVSVTIGGTSNANTEFTKTFINALDKGAGIHVSYSEAEARKAQKYVRAASKVQNADPSQSVIYGVLGEAGIDLSKETMFGTNETVTSYQILDIADQMDNWTETLAQEGISVDYEGAQFGYVTISGNGKTAIIMVMEYTAS